MTHDPRSLVRRTRQPASVSRPVSSPIQTSVVYASRDADELDAQYEGREQGFTYSREGHPNAAIVGAKIDWLEGVAPEWGKGVVTGSGMGAVSAVMLALLKAGDHVVAGNQLYGRSLRLLTQDMPRLGIEATLADPTDAAAFEAAIRPETRMILVEVVSNPTLRVAYMKAIAEIATLSTEYPELLHLDAPADADAPTEIGGPTRTPLSAWREAVRDAEYDLGRLEDRVETYRRR